MNQQTKKQIQQYEQTRIVNLMGSIEDRTLNLFQDSHPELYKYWEDEIINHAETRAKISIFRCKLQNTLKALQQ